VNAPADTEIARWSPVVLALARELWVVRDRVRAMEQLLTAHGTLAAGEIDRHQPSTEQQAQLDHDCEAFVARLVAEMRGF
jgi:hypothetical protein